MEELIARASHLITAYGAWAGPIVGLLAFGESLAVKLSPPDRPS